MTKRHDSRSWEECYEPSLVAELPFRQNLESEPGARVVIWPIPPLFPLAYKATKTYQHKIRKAS